MTPREEQQIEDFAEELREAASAVISHRQSSTLIIHLPQRLAGPIAELLSRKKEGAPIGAG